tara:strand:+ start:1711 stop:2751 length:1041 start_codon:yes stop_codon:yes gene_type:complete
MFKIKNRIISKNHKPFIIAELSGNHNGSLKNALKLIDIAAKCKVDAVKLQTFKANTITMKSDRSEFFIKDKKNIWKNQSLYQLYDKAHTPWDWHREIFNKAKQKKLIIFSSPFDETAVDFLEKLNAPAYKVASFEINHTPLLKRIAQTRKPVILSTGLASFLDIKNAITILKKNGCKKVAILKCTSSYPAKASDLNLRTIAQMKKKFNCEVGFSDHSIGNSAALTAIGMGATIIEKHLTLKKNFGIDGKFSSEYDGMSSLKKDSISAWQSMGSVLFGPTKNENRYLRYRRSIYTSKNIKKGEVFSKSNIKVIRPSLGLHPKYFVDILGKTSKKNINKGEPFKKKYY